MSKEKHKLAVKARDESGRNAARRARRAGMIPAILYSKGKESKSLYVEAKEWEVLSKSDFNLLNLVEGKEETVVLVQEVQMNYLKHQVVHIDFHEVRMDEEISTLVAVYALPGDPVGLAHGGVLEQQMHEVEVVCLPGSLPESFNVDISGMEIDDRLLAGDLEMPEGVRLTTNPDQAIFHVAHQAKMEEEEAPAVEDGADAEDSADGAEEPEAEKA